MNYRNWIARNAVQGSTAIARMFGRSVAQPLDLAQYFADLGTAPGAALAAAGLSEHAIMAWRRGHGHAAVALLDTKDVALSRPAEVAFERMTAHRPAETVMHADVHHAMVAAELFEDLGDAELDRLVADLGVDREALVAALLSCDEFSCRYYNEFVDPTRPRPAVHVFERQGRLVLVPKRFETPYLRDVPSGAQVVAADSAVDHIGQLVLDALSVFGLADEAGITPYWLLFKEKTVGGFERRARLVMVGARDATITIDTTANVGRRRFDGRSAVTPLYAPVDEPALIGRAVIAGIEASLG